MQSLSDPVQPSVSEQEKASVMALVEQLIPQWRGLDPSPLAIERMTGITNETYKVSHPQAPNPIIYRKFGDASENVFLDRKMERFVYQHISEERLGPKIYGYAGMVRLEEFIYSSVLRTEQMLMEGYYERVAFALRRFHEMKPPAEADNRSLFDRIYFCNPETIMGKCLSKLNCDIFTEREQPIVEELKNWITQEEIKFLQGATATLQQQQLVFSHNDLLANNILLRQPDGKAVFIDYEYSCFNYRIFDIANYFVESQYNYDVDSEPYFGILPASEDKQHMKDKFLRAYCASLRGNFPQFLKEIKQQNWSLREDEEKMYVQLKASLALGQMLAQVMWGWWAIIMSKNPNIQFDYLQFSLKRYEDYRAIKESGRWKM